MSESDFNDERQASFYGLIGFAITRWAHIDKGLFNLCKLALGTTPEKTAAVFYRSPSIGDHLGLTSALLKLTLSETSHKKLWKDAVKLIEDELPFRNDIAHNPTLQATRLPSRDGEEVEQWWAIQTEPAKKLVKAKRDFYYRREHLRDHIDKAVEISRALSTLLRELSPAPPK